MPQEDVLPTSIAESDSDHEPTSTVTIPTPPRNTESDEFATTNQALTENKNVEKVAAKVEPENVSVSSPSVTKKSEEIWRGTINMIDVAQISITAHEVSGKVTSL